MLFDIARGSYKGRTMYVIPYSMGPVGSPLAKIGYEVTDSIYVVLNMNIMTRVGAEVEKELGDSEDWIKGLHAKCDIDPEKRYICHFPNSSVTPVPDYGLWRKRAAGQKILCAAHCILPSGKCRRNWG